MQGASRRTFRYKSRGDNELTDRREGLSRGLRFLSREVRFRSQAEVSRLARHVRSTLDSVAKAALLKVSKILRAAGAVFV